MPLIALLASKVLPAGAQPYYFRHYQVENGLSSNTINCSIQDKSGFVWFGTKAGLNRFDGFRFKQYSLPKEDGWALTPDAIYCLYKDAAGRLWVGAQKGLFLYDEQREELVHKLNTVREVNNIIMDGTGNLWFTTASGLCRYHPGSGCSYFFPAEQTGPVTSVCLLPGGSLWFGTADGFLVRYNDHNRQFTRYDLFAHSPKPRSRFIPKIYPAGAGAIFAGTSNQGLKKFIVKTGTYNDLLTLNENKTEIYVRDILHEDAGKYWIATESGIFIYNEHSGRFTHLQKRFLDPYSLSDNAIYTLCKDNEGGIWAGTYFGGVNYFPKAEFAFDKYFPDYTANSIGGSVVREICPDKFGNLWIGTEDGGLNKMNTGTGSIRRFAPTGAPGAIAYSNIHALLAVDNELWIGTFEHGLDIMDIRSEKVIRHYNAGTGPLDLKNNFIVTMLQTRLGHIYVGTASGMFRYNRPHNGFERVKEVPDQSFISSLHEDRQGVIWAGTHRHGLFYFKPENGNHGNMRNEPHNTNSLTNNKINALFEDRRRQLWIATEGGGLCMLDAGRKKFTAITLRNGLPSNFIFKVLDDDQGNLWITTSKGLARMEPRKGSIRLFTKENGLLNDQFNYNSGYKDPSGKIYFGSIKGMIAFQPASFSPRPFKPPIYITGFQIHNRELSVTTDSALLHRSIVFSGRISLPHDQSSFSLDYSALGFTAPEMNTYSYIMEGLERDWTRLQNNRRIYFTNLAPGNYVFRVKVNGPENWAGRERRLSITILPPWWATRWAYACYTLFLLLLGWVLLRIYHRYHNSKKEKEIYEAKINFFTNVAHEIRTPLTLIKGPVDNLLELVDKLPEIKEDVTLMERSTNRLMKLVTQILDFRQTETKGFSLDFTKVNVSELVKEESNSFAQLAKKANLSYGVFLPEKPIWALADEDALRKIISNLLSNAVKYGATKVSVKLMPLQKEEAVCTLEVANDGPLIPTEMHNRIFDPFVRLKETARLKGTGIGLALARSLAQLHNGDLYVKESKGQNVFVLKLPLAPRAASRFGNSRIIQIRKSSNKF